ncbi:MAG TPA: pyrroline-5-carboxylate reductase, partial [Gammaproteobacteria bacterium]|nr:pyrroline-5-carboxylate reductase [Gammaproteobacteria bacterium]
MPATIAVLGAGNMGTALITGLIAKDYPANKLLVSDPSSEKLDQLQKKYKIAIFNDNKAAVKNADVVLLAVKPQIMQQIASDLVAITTQHNPLIISIAAGVTLENLQNWLGANSPIIRAMPNTPALVGSGATALFANSFVTKQQREIAQTILNSVGLTVWLDAEEQMDMVTALSGSGPAYFFLLMEIMQEVAEAHGLPKNVARLLTTQTALGAAQLAQSSDKSFIELRHQVTSPGGTTEAALKVLENENFHALM